ncbi:hypothetical protein [Roseobacter litoralis]|uniref:hypothetical protein n=1 Tax=Roseobacter litoralis TaxID=42443 RepID=UPI0024945222|nr:hypothetical protein [Roseobacter litoralis]
MSAKILKFTGTRRPRLDDCQPPPPTWAARVENITLMGVAFAYSLFCIWQHSSAVLSLF